MSEIFTRYLKSEFVSFKHAKGISERIGNEFHLFHEILLFLGGEAELVSETVHTKLSPQTLIVIPKETYHQIIIKGDQKEYCRCVFQFYNIEKSKSLIERAMKDLFITEIDKNIIYLFSKMMTLAKSENKSSEAPLVESVLYLLLDEIINKRDLNTAEMVLGDRLTKLTIEYISEKLTENLDINTIAGELNVSPSTLMHTFRKNMNIPIHKYIIKKRLIAAHTKISNGEQAVVAASECGFNDYSGFYKQYVNMFDHTPSMSNVKRLKE